VTVPTAVEAARRCWPACAVAALVATPLLASGCGGGTREQASRLPAFVQPVKGTDLERVVLTASAARRIGVRTTSVRRVRSKPFEASIPYSAVLYDPDGTTWTYTSPKPLVFVRRNITIDSIAAETAILAKGPPVGSRVVVEGSTEIWGVEYGGIEED
jgi:hypothetical protein